MFAIASVGAQILLRRYYDPFVKQDPRRRWLLRSWLSIYAFVAIQMAWLLRPFIGRPTGTIQFFREDVWDNAYVVVGRMIIQFVARLFSL